MNTLESIRNDLQYLYCKTKDKRIEALFLKADNGASLIIRDIFNVMGIPPSSTNSETYNALRSLLAVYDAVGGHGTYNKVSQYFLKNPDQLEHYPTLKLFFELYSEGKFTELFAPFLSILSVTRTMDLTNPETKMPIPSKVSKDQVEKDLDVILRELELLKARGTERIYDDMGDLMPKKKQSRKEKTENLISAMAKSLGTDAANAAKQLGMNRLASELDNGAIVNPVRMFKALGSQGDFRQLTGDVKKTAAIIMQNLNSRHSDEQINFLRSRSMVHAGAISFEEYQNFYLKQIQEKYEFPPRQKDSYPKMQFTKNQLVNPTSLMFISFVLYALTEKLR